MAWQVSSYFYTTFFPISSPAGDSNPAEQSFTLSKPKITHQKLLWKYEETIRGGDIFPFLTPKKIKKWVIKKRDSPGGDKKKKKKGGGGAGARFGVVDKPYDWKYQDKKYQIIENYFMFLRMNTFI